MRTLDANSMDMARRRIDALAKPLNGLGIFEDTIARLAGIYGTCDVPKLNGCVLVFCADNGVVAEGVSQSDASVTALVAQKMSEGRGNINAMARAAGAKVYPVDVGMLHDVDHPALIKRRVARGTDNIAHGAAMPKAQAEQAIQAGMDLVGEMAKKGHNLVCTGEMGIGNTTTSSALASVLLSLPAEAVTGRGAGLPDDGLRRKTSVIARAIELNQPDPNDPVDILAKLGGFDIAAMCGVFLGGMKYKVPVVIDGLISGVAALLAARMDPEATGYMLASHVSREPAGALLLGELGLSPVIHAGMALGEGTGAVMLLPLIQMALNVYRQDTAMSDLGLAQYERYV